ncbi:hypothetical protein GUJ93_ZPchr0004g38480 [Zizania palustris]|uniref:Uncharacterized protein n=1 Tax=Zizania palustris TaxID=103762 RepID=A0A8J5SKP8_ZIZPA|nr:hypothetical protein GUJ93_ZPchr0004g38480 [Zizania palustris]
MSSGIHEEAHKGVAGWTGRWLVAGGEAVTGHRRWWKWYIQFFLNHTLTKKMITSSGQWVKLNQNPRVLNTRENYSHAIIIFRNCLYVTVSDCGDPHLSVTH